eukprot:scaffold626366_cov14-Prasinocladus_malaysianus.AAC.1
MRTQEAAAAVNIPDDSTDSDLDSGNDLEQSISSPGRGTPCLIATYEIQRAPVISLAYSQTASHRCCGCQALRLMCNFWSLNLALSCPCYGLPCWPCCCDLIHNKDFECDGGRWSGSTHQDGGGCGASR